jgi:hypothetical protein
VQDDEFFTFAFVGDSSHAQRDLSIAMVIADNPNQGLFDSDMRDHLAADFRESTLAAGDGDKTVIIDDGDVTSVVPAVADYLGRFRWLIQIALHDVVAGDEQEPRLTIGQIRQ